MRHIARFTLLACVLAFCTTAGRAQCKGSPLLKVIYDGYGMVVNGEHLHMLVCDSGEIKFDDSDPSGGWNWQRKKALLSDSEKKALLEFLDEVEVRRLNGKYAVGKVKVRDHSEQVAVSVYRGDGEQKFSVVDFYGHVEESFAPTAIAFLCRVDKLRKGQDDWKPFEFLPCKTSSSTR